MIAGARAHARIVGWLSMALLLSVSVPARVHAQHAAEHVSAAYAVTDAEADELAQTLRSALDLPQLTSELRRVDVVDPRALIVAVPEAVRPLARIWVDLSHEASAFVYVVDRSWTHTYIRSIPRTPDNAALDCAQLGEIVRSAVQALQEGAVIGIAIERPSPNDDAEFAGPVVAAQPAAATRNAVVIGFGALYGVGLRAGGELAQGPGLYGYALDDLGTLALGGLLTFAYQPHRVTGPGIEARLDTFALRAGPVLELVADNSLAPRISISGGVDIVHLDPSARGDAVDASDARVLAYPMLTLLAGLRAKLTRDVELLIALTLDVDLVDTRYVRDLRDGPRVIEDPFRVRPALLLSLGFF